MPRELNDRQQDVCEPLIAIADRAGEGWPERARQALISLCSSRADGDVSVAVTLLADIRAYFGAGEIHDGHRRITTVTLLQCLNNIDESPWGEFNKGCALPMAQLARLLKPFEIRPRDLRFKYGVFKGYEARDFQDAWSRYLPAPSPPGPEGQQAQQTAIYAGSSDFSQGQHAPSVAPNKNAGSPINMRVVAGVAPVEPLVRKLCPSCWAYISDTAGCCTARTAIWH
jgi:hypothetical protein